jgi:hypothetical protein
LKVPAIERWKPLKYGALKYKENGIQTPQIEGHVAASPQQTKISLKSQKTKGNKVQYEYVVKVACNKSTISMCIYPFSKMKCKYKVLPANVNIMLFTLYSFIVYFLVLIYILTVE